MSVHPEDGELFIDGERIGATGGETVLLATTDGTRRLTVHWPGRGVAETRVSIVSPWYRWFPLDLLGVLPFPRGQLRQTVSLEATRENIAQGATVRRRAESFRYRRGEESECP